MPIILYNTGKYIMILEAIFPFFLYYRFSIFYSEYKMWIYNCVYVFDIGCGYQQI